MPGSFDLAYLGCLPGMVLMAPSDEAELVHMVATGGGDRRPAERRCAIRAARGVGAARCRRAARCCRSGKGRVLREGSNVAILSLGTRLADALKAADELAARGLPATVVDARFAKPLDTALVEQLARHHEVLITIEEGSVGGFGAAVLQHLAWKGLLDRRVEGAADGAAGPLHRPRQPAEAARRGRPHRERHRGDGAFSDRRGRRTHRWPSGNGTLETRIAEHSCAKRESKGPDPRFARDDDGRSPPGPAPKAWDLRRAD